jgi:murein hydrolase activator
MSRAEVCLNRLRSWPLLLSILLTGSLAVAAEDPLPEEQLQQLNAAISQIEDWLNSASNNRSDLESALREASSAITANRTAISDNEAELATLGLQLESLDTRQSALLETLAGQEDLIIRALRASYSSGRESYLKLLLTQEDASLGTRMLRYYADFNQARLASINAYRDTLAELDTTAAALESTSRQLEDIRQSLATQQQTLTRETEHRQTLLNALEAEIATRSGELEQLSADRQRLEDLVQQIQDAIINIPAPEQLTPFAQARGQLPRPVEGEAMNRFGASYSDGNLHRQGIVLSAAEGAPVRAVHPGRVVFSDWLRGSGLLVVVDHGEGYMSLYANNGSLIKRNGDWVNRGEALATAGSNGGMDASGIYFEIRHNGQAEDPATWWQP